MTKREKAKQAAKAVVKGTAGGIFGTLSAIWKYGAKWLIIANVVCFALVAGVYNWIYPEYTVVGYFINAVQNGDAPSTMAGMSIVALLLLGSIGYMINNSKRSLGWIGLIFMSALVGLVGFWMFTLGTFDGAGTAFIATIAQFGITFVLAFGLVYSKIDKILTGRINTDSTIIADEEE